MHTHLHICIICRYLNMYVCIYIYVCVSSLPLSISLSGMIYWIRLLGHGLALTPRQQLIRTNVGKPGNTH